MNGVSNNNNNNSSRPSASLQFRRACAKSLLDSADLFVPSVTLPRRTPSPKELDAWAEFVQKKLVDAGEGFQQAKIEQISGDYAKLVAIAEFELETDDFGSEPAKVDHRRVAHSIVDLKTSLIHLVDPSSNGPQLECGPRGSVLSPDSFRLAVSEQGMMRQFQGTAKEYLYLGVKVDSTNAQGETCLMFAAGAHQVEVVQFLLDNKANSALKTLVGATALHFAVQSGVDDDVVQTVQILLNSGSAAAHTGNQWGITPLHIAAFRGLTKTCHLLLTKGKADKSQSDIYGHSPSWYASEEHCSRKMDGTPVFDEKLLILLQ